MTEKNGYSCPFCGEASTIVLKTIPFANCVVRRRKCLTCGKTHETSEIPVEISKAWRSAVAILVENCAKEAQKSA